MDSSHTMAVLADIHGNSYALEAVLAHADTCGVTQFVNLGDTFYGPLDPAGTWALLKDMDIPTILGNQDRILLENGPQWETVPTFQRTLEAIGRDGLAWLKTLPTTLRIDTDILLCHGTPKDDMTYLLENIDTGLPAMRTHDALTTHLMPEANGCSLVLAGHSHHAGLVRHDGITLVNPGSVGLPAYADDDPPHSMTSGSPHARYAILTETGGIWDAEFIDVKYDWAAAANQAKAHGRVDWAGWLSTGLA